MSICAWPCFDTIQYNFLYWTQTAKGEKAGKQKSREYSRIQYISKDFLYFK